MATKKESDNRFKRLKAENELVNKVNFPMNQPMNHLKAANALANKVNLPLYKVLADFRILGIDVDPSQPLSENTKLEKLLVIYQTRDIRHEDAECKAMAEKLRKGYEEKEVEAIRLKQERKAKVDEEKRKREAEAVIWLDRIKEAEVIRFMNQEAEARKIGQLLDLCCELIPAPIAKKIIAECLTEPFIEANKLNNYKLPKTLSDIFLSSFYGMVEQYNQYKSIYEEYSYIPEFNKNITAFIAERIDKNITAFIAERIDKIDSYSILIPESIARDYSLSANMSYSSEDCNNDINKLKKCNRYTAALIETIYFSLNSSEIKESILQSLSPFKNLYFIGDLLIDIGAIDSALRLYKIDESIFNTPNRLSFLANKAVQSGNLDDSIKLVGKLIEQEPYHPSIPAIQAEIKRLEQRHRLKATFSIDFSKVDELSGVEFENLLLDKFAAMGFKAESTPKTGDFGADLIVENKEGTRIIVQCKRFKSKVNLKAVQEVVGAMGHYAGDCGVVITNNSFLNSAVKLAESHDIELWDGDRLVSFLAGDLSFSQVFS